MISLISLEFLKNYIVLRSTIDPQLWCVVPFDTPVKKMFTSLATRKRHWIIDLYWRDRVRQRPELFPFPFLFGCYCYRWLFSSNASNIVQMTQMMNSQRCSILTSLITINFKSSYVIPGWTKHWTGPSQTANKTKKTFGQDLAVPCYMMFGNMWVRKMPHVTKVRLIRRSEFDTIRYE